MRSRDDRAAGAAYVRAIVWGSLGLGVLLRVAAYVHNRALWADEALYAREIVTETIDHTVVANMPPLFKLATQLATRTFGTSECALRLFPLLCGLAALALFAVLTAQYLEPRARAIALLLFATSDRLIYFSSELKAYSTDVACALLLTIVGTRVLQGPLTTGRAIAFGALGGVLIWCSLPAVFVLAGTGTVIIVSAYLEHDTARLSRGVAAAAIWAVSFGGLYSLTSLRDPDNAGLRGLWSHGFMPMPPHSMADLKWYPVMFVRLFIDPGGFVLPGLAALAFVVGGVLLWERRRASAAMLISPFAFTLAASALALYPFTQRLLLFLLPACLLCIAAGTAWVIEQRPMIALPFGLMLLLPTVLTAAYHLKKPVDVEEIKPVLAHIREGWRPGDQLYVYTGAEPAFAYYAPTFGLAEVPVIHGTQARDDWQRNFDEVDRLRGRGRVWMLFSHVYSWGPANEERLWLFRADQIGTRLDAFAQTEASSYLYDFP